MELTQIEQLAVALALAAVVMCGGTLLRTQLFALGAQGLLLAACCALLAAAGEEPLLLVLAGTMLLIKAVGIPWLLLRTVSKVGVLRDNHSLHPSLALLGGCVLLIAGYTLAPQFAVPTLGQPLAAGMAVAMLFIGMFQMISRRLAISQITGFLTLENGIALYSLTQTRNMPLLIEMGIVFEALVAVLIAAVVIYRADRSGANTDVALLRGLKH
jgi:hydrogenase-4 component E